jgi:hypothetical protein
VGQPCDASNCDYCQASEDGGFQYCSRTCDSDFNCNGGLCIGCGNGYTCHRKCSSFLDNGCPGRCDSVSDNNGYPEYFCAEGFGVQHAPQAIGTECRSNTDCASNLCHTISESCADPLFGCLLPQETDRLLPRKPRLRLEQMHEEHMRSRQPAPERLELRQFE